MQLICRCLGAQGITEIMYKASFGQVFKGALLPASMCLTRGLNFYFLLIVSAVTAIYCHFSVRRKGLKGSPRLKKPNLRGISGQKRQKNPVC